MIQYLVTLLDDTSVSFCHYENTKTVRRLMPLETLKDGILYAMKENLNIQFVYPDYELPREYLDAIDTIDHTDIKSFGNAEVVVLNGLKCAEGLAPDAKTAYALRLSKEELFDNVDSIASLTEKVSRLNIIITDIGTFSDADLSTYKDCLSALSAKVEAMYVKGLSPQLNILTDRMMLDKMNNCGAGDTTITLAPDGRFYVCPAFYLERDDEDFGLGKAKFSIGDLRDGLDIKNPQLYKLDHAPLCRHCDAYQCKCCVWLNRKMTYEVNTPSHEQCVVAHLERDASRELLLSIRKHGTFLPDREEIKKIDYLDPFDVRKEW